MSANANPPDFTHVSGKDPWAAKTALMASMVVLSAITLFSYFFGVFLAVSIVGPNAQLGGNLLNQLQYVAQDTTAALIWLIAIPLVTLVLWRLPEFKFSKQVTVSPAVLIASAAIFSLVASYVFRAFAFQSYDLSSDEYLVWWQATIFLNGDFAAPVPADVLEIGSVYRPIFVFADEELGLWASAYRPVFAGLRALAMGVGLDAWLNPFLAAVTACATGLTVRKLYPQTPSASFVALAVLVFSAQFFVTAGSGFAYTAHLAFNSVWLLCFLIGGVYGHTAAAVLGVLAIGLHQVHVHPLFAAPFLAALLYGPYRNWRAAGMYAATYSCALLFWIGWPETGFYLQSGNVSAFPDTFLALRFLDNAISNYSAGGISWEDPVLQNTTNMLRLFLWLSPAAVLCFFLAVRFSKTLPLVVQLCLVSTILTPLFYWFAMPNQFHAWGYRFFHPVLGCLAIAAAGGYVETAIKRGGQSLPPVVVALSALALILLPLRFSHVAEKVQPRANAQAFLDSLDQDYAWVHPATWFGDDFVRNSPYMDNRPVIISPSDYLRLPKAQEAIGAHIEKLPATKLEPFGVSTGTLLEPRFH